jgi:hypothetical protein
MPIDPVTGSISAPYNINSEIADSSPRDPGDAAMVTADGRTELAASSYPIERAQPPKLVPTQGPAGAGTNGLSATTGLRTGRTGSKQAKGQRTASAQIPPAAFVSAPSRRAKPLPSQGSTGGSSGRVSGYGKRTRS